MRKQVCFTTTAASERALDVAVAALRNRQPGQTVSRSDAIRAALVAFAISVQRVAKLKSPTVARAEAA
jgi:hypothetical protein